MAVTTINGDNLKWSIDIIISSRDLNRILEPVVRLEFTTESGEKQSVELPVSKFHSLRYNVALLCKEMETVAHRISQIKSIS